MNDFFKKMTGKVKDVSLNRLVHLVGGDTPESNDLDMQVKYEVKSHFMAMIILSNNDIQIYFTTYFNSDSPCKIVAKSYAMESSKVTQKEINGFAKEYCNMVGGYIRNHFYTRGLKLNISIPWVTRAFDEIFFDLREKNNTSFDFWKLKLYDEEIILSSKINLLNLDVVKKDINFADDVGRPNDGGNIQFF